MSHGPLLVELDWRNGRMVFRCEGLFGWHSVRSLVRLEAIVYRVRRLQDRREELEEARVMQEFHRSMNEKIAVQQRVVDDIRVQARTCIEELPNELSQEEETPCNGLFSLLAWEEEKLDRLLHDLGYMG